MNCRAISKEEIQKMEDINNERIKQKLIDGRCQLCGALCDVPQKLCLTCRYAKKRIKWDLRRRWNVRRVENA